MNSSSTQEKWELKQFFYPLKQHPIRLLTGILAVIIYALVANAPAYYAKNLVDSISHLHIPTYSDFLYVAVFTFILFFIKGIAAYTRVNQINMLGLLITRKLRARVFYAILEIPIIKLRGYTSEKWISHFTNDINRVDESITTMISGPFSDIPKIIVLLGILILRSWELFLICSITLPFLIKSIHFFGKKKATISFDQLSEFKHITGLVKEMVYANRIIKAFGMGKNERDKFDKANQNLENSFMQAVNIEASSRGVLEFLVASYLAIALCIGGYLLNYTNMTAGDFVSFLVAFVMIYEPIKNVNKFLLQWQDGKVALQAIADILNKAKNWQEQNIYPDLKPFSKEITFDIHSFSYQNRESVLHDISFTIPKGKKIALVGSSGSGKTTLASILAGFYQCQEGQGTVYIDGQDVAKVSETSLCQQIAFVTQDTFLFDGSLASNIAYGQENILQKEFSEAVQNAYLQDVINQNEQGIDQNIGENGALLSGGQRQRVSIARTFYKNSPIIILDEATSALDTESERKIQEALYNLMKTKTILIIAHRLSTIMNADLIYVLDQGTIIEQGTYKELLAKNGRFASLHKSRENENE